MYLFVQFGVYGHMQTEDRQPYTRVLQCSPASVGLTQAHPNYFNIVHELSEPEQAYLQISIELLARKNYNAKQ